MLGISATGSRKILAVLAVATAVALAGCSDVDDVMFGDSGSDQTAAPADTSGTPGTLSSDNVANAGTNAGTLPGSLPNSAATATAAGPGITITPVAIEPGSDTGTAVGQKVGQLRADLSSLQDKITSAASQFSDLRAQAAQSASGYHESKAQITTRLQLGTTRGNPELVAQWNTAQTSLDELTTSINSLNALGTTVAGDSSRAHFDLDTIEATFNVSGAVDEDHRQLSVLEDETDQSIVLIDRLMREVSEAVQRQTAYVANERANLTTLASAIKNGELYGSELGSPMLASASAPYAGGAPGGSALVTIRFDHPDVQYQQILYTALAQALQSRPGAGFDVVGISPTRGTAAAVQLAQTEARRHAQDVLRSMSEMGVPATRLNLTSSTDPSLPSTEVRVYVR
ncbi:MAG TPA: hypothetical protein VHU84_00260 [Lacipirellulaceae bacterium]|jgi:peptidoglycan hydrolase CwlO-like protein|nr:hypothetical protein [Lacipirellulaceae bacterium]